jgi:hypothetical protein
LETLGDDREHNVPLNDQSAHEMANIPISQWLQPGSFRPVWATFVLGAANVEVTRVSEDCPAYFERRTNEELTLAKSVDDLTLKARHLNRAAYFAAAGERARDTVETSG